jgi:O-antigen ligase
MLVSFEQYEALVLVILGVRIIEDFYHLVPLPLYFPVVALALAMGVIALFFLTQSEDRPWVALPHWRVWLIFLVLPVPAMLLAADIGDSITYYLSVFVSAVVFALLGTLLARDTARVRRLLNMVEALGAAIAAHGIIASVTGVFILSTPELANYLVTKSDLRITGTQFKRLGSFLFNPDTCGIFLAVVALLALGLLLTSSTRWGRSAHSIVLALLVLALLLTFSTAAMLAFGVGLLCIALLIGSKRLVLAIGGVVVAGGLVIFALFPAGVEAYLIHATRSGEVTLREGIWLTALRVIAAHPLFGVGLGPIAYLTRAEPYRVPLQTTAEAHPHNAFLEFAAMGGIPVALAFLCLLVLFALQLRATSRQAPPDFRPIVASGAAACLVATCVNSLASNGWTVFPMVALVWFVLGALTSPALRASFAQMRRTPQSARAAQDHLDPLAATAGVAQQAGATI